MARPLAEALLAIAVGLIVGAAIMLIWNYDPIHAYLALLRGAFGDIEKWASTLSMATPLVLTALTFLVGVKAGLFNIGAEGQVYLGAVGAVAASLFVLPPGVHLLVALLFAMVFGALWSLPAAILKVTRGVHEVISTIMLNWIATWLTRYMVNFPLVDPQRAEKTISVAPTSRFPVLVSGTELTLAIAVSIVAAVVVYYFLWHTTLGYQFRAVGLNPEASRYAGMSRLKIMALSLVMGGLTAGLAGASQVVGRPPTWALYGTLANIVNLGFNGLAVAMIGRSHPIGSVFAAVFFGGLYTGARQMQVPRPPATLPYAEQLGGVASGIYGAGVPIELIAGVQGVIVLAVAVPGALDVIRKFLRRRRG
ncbi:MAG: ABC transporter permease, partial [Anaerolineae bacterium]|nr:ABC transporter permease [Anaerolineae bacterium]NIN98512.1 ABC transporter permease [Anaerolineae bacterium]NIQ81407.1 ABC transporter permease [Anaerolineae bacterium]